MNGWQRRAAFAVNAREGAFAVNANEDTFTVNANEVTFTVNANEATFAVNAIDEAFTVRHRRGRGRLRGVRGWDRQFGFLPGVFELRKE